MDIPPVTVVTPPKALAFMMPDTYGRPSGEVLNTHK